MTSEFLVSLVIKKIKIKKNDLNLAGTTGSDVNYFPVAFEGI